MGSRNDHVSHRSNSQESFIGVASENILLTPWEPKLFIYFSLGCWKEYKTFKSPIVKLVYLPSSLIPTPVILNSKGHGSHY